MAEAVLVCGRLFDGLDEALQQHRKVRIDGGAVAEVSGAARRALWARGFARHGDMASEWRVRAPRLDARTLCIDGFRQFRAGVTMHRNCQPDDLFGQCV